MAQYNSREWDRGKNYWNDPNSWNGTARPNIRPRDEEQYGEGKRRKHNDGGYDLTHPYNSTSGWEASNLAQNRPPQLDHLQDDDRQQRGSQNKKRLVASEPSPHVIFLGLDPDFTEADLQAYLVKNGCSIETVTIIRERSTGASKGFGFAQFPSTEHARAFVDPLFPFIQMPSPASHGASATAAFYKALEAGLPHNGRRVKIDYSQSATPHEKGRGRQNMNDGTRDIGNSQASVLLFRGLDPLSGPQAITQAMMSSSGPGKQGAKGMKRIVLIKDKMTLASFGFAFVEFVDAQSASAVLAATMSPQIHPAGFRISDRPVAASFAHPYSFQPVTDYMLRDDAAVPSSIGLGGVEGSWVRYWDESSTIAMLEFNVEEPAPSAAPTLPKKEKKKAKDVTVPQPSAPAEASTLPISDKLVTLSFNKGAVTKPITSTSSVVHVKPNVPISLGFSFADESDSPDLGGDANDQSSADGSLKLTTGKKVAPLIASQKTVNNINKWNQVQEGLKSDTSATLVAPAATELAGKTQATITTSKSVTPLPEVAEFEFSDTNAMTCLLCARQFKTLEQLKRHNTESDLHKKNFKDPNLRDVAKQKAINARQGTYKPAEPPKYRDRASERRVMHNQPEAPLPVDTGRPAKKRQAEGLPPPPSPPPPPPVNPGQDTNNVGNKLLKMMGWTEGTGLGTSGEGRVEPIQTAIYAQGAGLGASKGKEIGKLTDGYSGYTESAREAARERYGG